MVWFISLILIWISSKLYYHSPFLCQHYRSENLTKIVSFIWKNFTTQLYTCNAHSDGYQTKRRKQSKTKQKSTNTQTFYKRNTKWLPIDVGKIGNSMKNLNRDNCLLETGMFKHMHTKVCACARVRTRK